MSNQYPVSELCFTFLKCGLAIIGVCVCSSHMVSSKATAPTPSLLIQLTPRAAAPLEGTASRLMGLHMDNSHPPAVRVFFYNAHLTI